MDFIVCCFWWVAEMYFTSESSKVHDIYNSIFGIYFEG